MNKLKKRWGITSNFQLVLIFIVFAINGSLSARISSLLLDEFGLTKDNTPVILYYIILLILVLPLYPFMLLDGQNAILLSVGSSIVGLFGIGAAITLLTGKSILFSGFRQVGFGLAAAAITYGIGSLIGVSLAG